MTTVRQLIGQLSYHRSERHKGKSGVGEPRKEYAAVLIWLAMQLLCPCDQI